MSLHYQLLQEQIMYGFLPQMVSLTDWTKLHHVQILKPIILCRRTGLGGLIWTNYCRENEINPPHSTWATMVDRYFLKGNSRCYYKKRGYCKKETNPTITTNYYRQLLDSIECQLYFQAGDTFFFNKGKTSICLSRIQYNISGIRGKEVVLFWSVEDRTEYTD